MISSFDICVGDEAGTASIVEVMLISLQEKGKKNKRKPHKMSAEKQSAV